MLEFISTIEITKLESRRGKRCGEEAMFLWDVYSQGNKKQPHQQKIC